MREILFRGKSLESGIWAYGHYVGPVATDANHSILASDANGVYWEDVDPETLGQYTGLTDKNGKKIFEGDIIKTHYANTPKADFIEQVVFHNGRFCGMYEHDKMKMWATLADGIKHLPQDKSVYMEWCEIIGNIHDNPELLEVQHD